MHATKGPSRLRLAGGVAVLAVGWLSNPALPQEITRNTAIEDLPRPGYESRTIQAGSFVIEPMIEGTARYDTNVFASPSNERDDFFFVISPSVIARRNSGSSNLYTRAYVNAYRYAQYQSENVTTFGGIIDYKKKFSDRQSITGKLFFDRTFERRSDPEAFIAQFRRPAQINSAGGELEFEHQGGRFGIVTAFGATKLDYLSVDDADRDMVTYTARVKGSVSLSERIALFVEPFANRRDPRLRFDRFGVDRRATTYGATGGVAVQIADRLTGQLGLGLFRTKPGDLGLPPYTGLAANGQMTWRPRTRTAINFDMFRGDVATVRSGALGRVDTIFNLGIDQEVRHNLLLFGSVGYRKIKYRGDFDVNQRYLTAHASARYLLNRHVWTEVGAQWMDRASKSQFDEFKKWQIFLKLGFKY